MAGAKKVLKTGFKVYKHHDLSKVTEEEIGKDPSKLLAAADQGIQSAVISADGKRIRSIVGLNGTRYLPDPEDDPLDEILRTAFTQSPQEKK
jgi:hypothetical protein